MRKEVLVAAGAVAATAVTAAAAAVARKQGDLSGVWKPTRTDEWSRSPLRNCSLSRIHVTIHLGAHSDTVTDTQHPFAISVHS